jgi:carboxylate-amine ligase
MTRRQVGVEEEMLLVDPLTRRPVAGIAEIQATDGIEHELTQQQAEIASAPFTDTTEVLADLYRRRADLIEAAEARGLAVAATATSPLSTMTTVTDEDRYHRMTDRFGLLARQELTCGMHTHVSISSPAEGVAVLDGIRPWLHVLTALSANSPFWQGEDSGYASYRTIVWGQWPTAGPTSAFGSEETYRRVVADLTSSGTILDEGMIYFDARLSRHYPTVEIRVADVCTDARDAVVVAALARALVDTAADADTAAGTGAAGEVRVELLRVAAWGAARWGVAGSLLDPIEAVPRPAPELLQRLVDDVRPSLKANEDLDLVESGLHRMLGADQSGAGQQRAVRQRSGLLEDVVSDLVLRTKATQAIA